MSNPRIFEEKFQAAAKKKVQVKINDNRSTMLSVKWEPRVTKVSMHRIFLEAPQNVMEALACHVCKKNSDLAPLVKEYIAEKSRTLNYSTSVKARLSTQGNYYDLQAIYDAINEEYFDGELDLLITWYGKLNNRGKTRVTFGLYQPLLRLVKIHRLMDRPFFPDYFVQFVVYHELLHHVCPSYYEASGRQSIHTREFREKEREFRHYEKAQKWLDEHHDTFFTMM